MTEKTTWNGRRGRKVDLKALIEKKKESTSFREAYDEARTSILLSRALARIREEYGLSQRELAKRLGTSQAAISRLENPNYRGHSLNMVVRFAEALGQSVSISFLGKKGRPHSIDLSH